MFGSLFIQFGKPERAIELTKDIDPTPVGLSAAHDYKLTIGLETGDQEEVLRQLIILRDDYGFQFADLRTAEGWEDFVASPQFANWEASEKASK